VRACWHAAWILPMIVILLDCEHGGHTLTRP
jgi:hypothetical protein